MKMRLITMGIAVFVFSTSSILAVDFKPAAGGQQIVATGLTPGATTIWIGLARIPERYHSRVEEYVEETLVDSAGNTVLEVRDPIAFRSVWFAVDLSTGQFAARTPEGYEPQPLRWFRGNPGPKLAKLESEVEQLITIVVRPQTGTWGLRLIDQSTDDDDDKHGRAIADWAKFRDS